VSSAAIAELGGEGLPVLGVCLGHQCIGEVFGARVVRAPEIVHGKASPIHNDGRGVFKDLPRCSRPLGTIPSSSRPTPFPTA